MRKIAVVLYGPPGSGKSTQARLVADALGLIYFDSGKFFESILYDPKRKSEKTITRERRLFEAGKLLAPSFALHEAARQARKIAQAGWGTVFTGDPRTLYEAKGLLPELEKLYGRKHLFFFLIDVPSPLSLRRNTNRLVCKVCHSPLLTEFYPSKRPKHCPVCGGPFYRRSLDNPKTIRVRLQEYRDRTTPIFDFIKKRGYRLVRVDGRPAPYKVFRSIYGQLKNAR